MFSVHSMKRKKRKKKREIEREKERKKKINDHIFCTLEVHLNCRTTRRSSVIIIVIIMIIDVFFWPLTFLSFLTRSENK